jgi:hypothetical protein
MPLKLSITIEKIENISDTNIEFINKFLGYIRSNGSSKYHQYITI